MSRKLFVGNLPYSVTSERLGEAFSQFGTVSSSKVIADRETGRSRGFAFLEMETDDQGAATAATFVVVLWSVGGSIAIGPARLGLELPGYLVFASIAYAMLGGLDEEQDEQQQQPAK